MAMTMAVELVREAAEATIGHALAPRGGTSVRARDDLTNQSRTTIAPLDKAHRYGADGAAPHHGQDDAARAFHGAALGVGSMLDCGGIIKTRVREAGKRKTNLSRH